MDRAKQLFMSLTPKGRMALAGTVAGVLIFGLIFMKMAGSPSYTTLASGLDPADTGKVTSALDEKGIKNELQNNGTAVGVDKSQLSQARIALAEKGLPGTNKPGYELFDKQKMGASDFQQKVTYQRALEGELSRTIGDVDGVSGAQVQLTLPDDKLFAEDQKPATAAVLLSGGTDMDPGTVRGIARLAASSVEGLKPANVTITDSSGSLLWPNGSGGDGGGGGSSKQAVEDRYERGTEAQVNAMLAQTAGPGKARVQVNADVDADQSDQQKLVYAKKGTPVREKVDSEKLTGGSGGGAGGNSGTGGNVANYAQTAGGGAGGAGSNYTHTTTDRDLGVNKTVTRTKIAPGSVKRQSVALIVDDSVPASQVSGLRKAVAAAVGLDPSRKDTLAVSSMPFAKTPAPGGGGLPGILGILKWVGLGIASLVFLFFMARGLKKRENTEITGEPMWLREINSPLTLAQLEHPTQQLQPAYTAPPTPEEEDRRAVEDASSERLANQVRSWMKE